LTARASGTVPGSDRSLAAVDPNFFVDPEFPFANDVKLVFGPNLLSAPNPGPGPGPITVPAPGVVRSPGVRTRGWICEAHSPMCSETTSRPRGRTGPLRGGSR